MLTSGERVITITI